MSITNDVDSGCYGYIACTPQFIVCDSTNYMDPLIYTLDDSDMDDAYNGFIHKGKTYPGVKDIIQGLKWAQDNDVWSISKKNYELGGVVNIKK